MKTINASNFPKIVWKSVLKDNAFFAKTPFYLTTMENVQLSSVTQMIIAISTALWIKKAKYLANGSMGLKKSVLNVQVTIISIKIMSARSYLIIVPKPTCRANAPNAKKGMKSIKTENASLKSLVFLWHKIAR